MTDAKTMSDEELLKNQIPSLKTLETKISNGYDLLDKKKYKDACLTWLDGWKDFQLLYQASKETTLSEIEESLPDSIALNDWLEQFSCELWNLGLDQPEFFKERIAFCTKILESYLSKEYGERHDQSAGYWKECLAETLYEMGEEEKADALFETWLAEEPAWGYGWIRWARLKEEKAESRADNEKCETILRRGLAIKNVRDANRLKLNLAKVVLSFGNCEEAKSLSEEIDI